METIVHPTLRKRLGIVKDAVVAVYVGHLPTGKNPPAEQIGVSSATPRCANASASRTARM